VFGTTPVPFAVRDPLPGVDLDAADRPGFGVALWLHASDAQALHDRLAAAGVPIVTAPFDGPFGRTFTFTDPDGYALTIHDKAVSAATNSFRMRARGPSHSRPPPASRKPSRPARGRRSPDAFPTHEKRLHRAMAAVYHLNPGPEALRAIADCWRPYRTWIALLLRAWLEDVTHEIAEGRRVDLLPDQINPNPGHDPT
jgi:Glyoxalase/Bleomycin resistance protein/Dioxygenase superfamily